MRIKCDNIISRATTPTFTLKLPFAPTDATELLVTLSEYDRPIINKREDDLQFLEENRVRFTLSQAETKKFACGDAFLQVRAVLNGRAVTTKIIRFRVVDVLNDEEMEVD